MRLRADDTAFFPQRVTLASGIEVEVPYFTLRKDEQLRHLLTRVMSNNQVGVPVALLSPDTIFKAIGLVLTGAPVHLTHMASTILERDVAWVRSNCDTADMIELVGAFVLSPVEGSEDDSNSNEPAWTLARLIDFFASEYSWNVDDVLNRTRWQLKVLVDAASQRHEDRNKAMEEAQSGKSGRRKNPYKRRSCVEPLSQRKIVTAEQSQQGIAGLTAFAKSRGVYEQAIASGGGIK